MSSKSIAEQKRDIVERYGPWTAHNILLAGDVYTIGPELTYDTLKLRRITQIVSDNLHKPWPELRILDLACLEGQYAVELARRGARVVGIEGREANIEKARFAQRVHGLANLELVQDDVRNLSADRYGRFDVVLCLGILYHLDAPDVFRFVRQIGGVCDGFAVIDTHVSSTGKERHTYEGRTYWGATWVEHRADSPPEERLQEPWLSLDNQTSFKLTRPSLLNLLSHQCFTSVYECLTPAEPSKPADRVTLLALRGEPATLLSAPPASGVIDEWPERPRHRWPAPPHCGERPSLLRRLVRTFAGWRQ